tara:strand:+ start:38017 stop:38556 length:540 start_codon:yes stop_codon:yes gene_type:complete
MKGPKNELVLYNIASEIYELEAEIMRCGGEIGEREESLIEELGEILEERVDEVVQFVQQMDDEVEMGKKRLDEIKQFIKVRENTRERIKTYALEAMKKLGKKAITGAIYEVKTRKPTQVLEILNEDDVPLEYLDSQVIVKIDKKALLKAVKSGEVDHPSIGIVDGKESLMFKTKTVKKA